MKQRTVAPYGAWKSPITSEWIVSTSVRLSQVTTDRACIAWVEARPREQGRHVVVTQTLPELRLMREGNAPKATSSPLDLTPPTFNVRSRVHEYGGGAYLLTGGTLIFSNFSDDRLYRQIPGGAPEPITPIGTSRYADLVLDARRDRLICVREDHPAVEGRQGVEAVNTLVSLALDGSGMVRTLATAHDFFASPRLSPDGTHLAWLTWEHPNLPWDGTRLWTCELAEDGTPGTAHCVAGGDNESIFQPEWSPEGVLHFVSDRSGWWNLYRFQGGSTEPLWPKEAEFGQPQWVFGQSTYAFLSATEILCTFCERGVWKLARLDTVTSGFTEITTPFTWIESVRSAQGSAILLAASATEPLSVVTVDPETGANRTLRRSNDAEIGHEYLSVPEAIAFPTLSPAGEEQTAYGFFYPPTNGDFKAPEGERPPLIVLSHGGPTAAAATRLEFSLNSPQFWTSRGFAVMDVNYGGSTGYGRVYRERLNGCWGLVDVEDCVQAALTLAARSAVDGCRLAIRGGSAGGYTTLAALTFRDTFHVGVSYYGIGDLEALARDTHKFESRYLERLIGPYPERSDLYRERSPLHFVERLNCPVIFFQGLEDKVVPPNQAEEMVHALRTRGVPVKYVTFEGEGHGFHRAETLQRCLEAELAFYAHLFEFTPAKG